MTAQPHEQTAVIREGAAAAQPEAQAGQGVGGHLPHAQCEALATSDLLDLVDILTTRGKD